MILRLMGREDEALAALDEISAEMEIISMSYHQLCLLYKGEASLEEMMAADGDDPSNAAVAYGVANYLYYNGDRRVPMICYAVWCQGQVERVRIYRG